MLAGMERTCNDLHMPPVHDADPIAKGKETRPLYLGKKGKHHDVLVQCWVQEHPLFTGQLPCPSADALPLPKSWASEPSVLRMTLYDDPLPLCQGHIFPSTSV